MSSICKNSFYSPSNNWLNVSALYIAAVSLVNQTLSSGWRLSIRDYKRPSDHPVNSAGRNNLTDKTLNRWKDGRDYKRSYSLCVYRSNLLGG